MKHCLILIIFLITFVSCRSGQTTTNNHEPILVNHEKYKDKPFVVMLSLDGYRYDYTQKYHPPHIKNIMKSGVYSEGLIPIFPSKTFPNHYAIVTGMKANKNGIVSNHFYNPIRGEEYKLGRKETTTDGSWYLGEPLWVNAAKNEMVSASFFWVGSDANIQNRYPSYWKEYDGSISNEQRVKQVIDWLSLPQESRPHLITMYFSDVDSAGHKFGPDSEEVKEAVLKVDEQIGILLDAFSKLDFPVNFIITSDHGMEKIDPAKRIILSDYIEAESEDYKIVGKGAHSQIYFKDKSKIKEIYKKLKNVKGLTPVYSKDFAKKYGYKSNPAIGEISLNIDPGYYLFTSTPKFPATGGTHGYDPYKVKNMHGIFYATGANIKPLGKIKSFENVHIYPLVTDLLGLPTPKDIDGNLKVLKFIRR